MALETITLPVLPIVKDHLIVNCVIVLLTLIVVGLRIAARVISGAWLGWDDWLILLAVPQGVAMLVIQGLYLPMGVGYHISETMPNLEIILKLMVSYAIIYTFCIGFIKLSVLFFYLRVFVGKTFRLVTYSIIGVVTAWSVANVLLLFLICRPFAANYDLTITGSCGDRPTAFIAIGAFNIISDVVILVLPIPVIWGLRAQKKWKMGLTGILLLGLVVSAIAVGRIFTLTALELTNITETMVWVDFLSTTEVNLGIFCVSIPMLGPVYKRFVRHNKGSKLSATPDPNNAYERSSRSTRNTNKRRMDDTIGLDTIYDNNLADNHNVTVMATNNKDRSESDSVDGSEVSITKAAERPTEIPGDEDQHNPGRSIKVQTQWTVRHA